MRMSCNGCRVLRKGCSEDCSLRPCLQWIMTPESQGNATLFLAKFYGRAGLINLINAGPTDLRPAIFKSLLYEACGRIINPVHGSVGMMSSGNWKRCQAAVEAVLQGSPVMMPGPRDGDGDGDGDGDDSLDQGEKSTMPLQLCDIRHLSKEAAAALHRNRIRKRFKRTEPVKNYADILPAEFTDETEAKFTITGWDCATDNKGFDDERRRAASHDSGSVETTESELVNRVAQPVRRVKPEPYCGEIGLDLTLGLNSLIDISDSEA